MAGRRYRNLHANMSSYGLPANLSSRDPHMTAYTELGQRVRRLMDTPGCKLRIHWRNFWSACGDPARYMCTSAPSLSNAPINGG